MLVRQQQEQQQNMVIIGIPDDTIEVRYHTNCLICFSTTKNHNEDLNEVIILEITDAILNKFIVTTNM